MYLQNRFLIDIIPCQNFNKEAFIKSDTASFDFYDLVNQKHFQFDRLSIDAKTIKRGRMADNGSFSNTADYDPMNGIPDTVWKLCETPHIRAQIKTVLNDLIQADIKPQRHRDTAKHS